MTILRARVLNPKSATAAEYIEDARVVIEDGRLTSVGPYDGSPGAIDLRPGLLVPGFVDAHVHFPQTRVVGSASGPLLDWLSATAFPEEERFSDPAFAQRVARVFSASLAAAGTTGAFVYGSVHTASAEALFEGLRSRGLRARVGPVLMDEHVPEPLAMAADPALDALDRLREHACDRVSLAVIPRFALACSMPLMRRAGDFASEHGLWVSTHLSENPAECQVATERFSAPDYLSIYEQAGLVHDRSVYAHCIHLSDDEWDRMAKAGAVVAHCPDSNDFLGSGGMPVEAVRSRSIPVALGSDIAAGRSFRIPRMASSAYDNGLRQGVSIPLETLFWWATRGGAQALGWQDTGALEPGLAADMVLVDLPPWAEDRAAVLHALLFDQDRPAPRRTWAAGEVVWDRPSMRHPWALW